MCAHYNLLVPKQLPEIQAMVQEAWERLRQRNTQHPRARLVTEGIRPTDLSPVLFPYQGELVSAPAFWGFTNWSDIIKVQTQNTPKGYRII